MKIDKATIEKLADKADEIIKAIVSSIYLLGSED